MKRNFRDKSTKKGGKGVLTDIPENEEVGFNEGSEKGNQITEDFFPQKESGYEEQTRYPKGIFHQPEKREKTFEIEKFNPHEFYLANKRATSFKLLASGTKMAAQYYVETYYARISVPDIDVSDLQKFTRNIDRYLPSDACDKREYRHAFLIGAGSAHVVPVIYIVDNDKKAVLYADSLGAQTPPELTGITGYAVIDRRQSDYYSCFVDALILSKNATTKNPFTEQYELSNLLLLLEQRAQQKGNYFSVKLPDKLLKTSQDKLFIEKHQQKSTDSVTAPLVHKNETITMFTARYFDEKSQRVMYLKEKGIKLTHTIEIQFYINAIQKKAGCSLAPEQRRDFIIKAKEILTSADGKKILFSQDNETQNDSPYNLASERLYQFALEFLLNLQNGPKLLHP